MIITSNHEHPAVDKPLEKLRQKGIEIRRISAVTAEEFQGKILECVQNERDRVALIIISHVSYKDGRIFPVEPIGEIAARNHIPYIVDGAQALGQIAVNLQKINPSVYVFSGHKWLFGPMGTGGMWVEHKFSEKYGGAWSSWTSKCEKTNRTRFDAGTINFGLMAGFLEAINSAIASVEERYHSLSKIHEKIADLMLDRLPSWKLVGWKGKHVPGILTYRIPDEIDPRKFTDDLLNNYGVVIKPFDPDEFDPQEKPKVIRISFSPWTSPVKVSLH